MRNEGSEIPVWRHVGFTTVLKYYLDWWKSGQQPALSTDSLAFFHLTQLAGEGKGPFPPSDYKPDQAADVVHVTALLATPGTVSITSGENAPVTFAAPAGISHWRAPASPGAQTFALVRAEKTVLKQVSGRKIASPPEVWTWSHYSEVVMA